MDVKKKRKKKKNLKREISEKITKNSNENILYKNEFFNALKKEKYWLSLGFLCSIISSILLIVPLILIFEVVKIVLEKTIINFEFVTNLFIIAFFIILLRYLIAFLSSYFFHKAAFNLVYNLRVKLTKHISKFPMGFWNSKGTSEVLKVVQNDVEAIEEYIGHQLPDGICAITLPIIILIYLSIIDYRLAFFASIPVILIVIIFRSLTKGTFFGKDRKKMTKKYHFTIQKMNLSLFEFVRGMPIIKIFNITANSFDKLKNSVEDYRKTVTDWQKDTSPYRAFINSLVFSAGIFILPASIFFLKNNSIKPITVLLFMILTGGSFYGLLKAMMIWTRVEFIKVGVEKINQLFNLKSMIEPKKQDEVFPKEYDIKIENLSFKYDKSSDFILKDVNLKIEKNSFVALVGPSGAGKTTLVNLIARMWDVSLGSIKIGGFDLREIGSSNISEIVGYVFQENYILTDSVLNNICLGKKVDFQEVVKACKAANCHDFIESLPKKYETIIGDGGEVHLSGGEKQRLSLARVILKDPPIVLLDEATCYADSENEQSMQKAFSKLMKNKTVIVIAHRLPTIAKADKIFVISDGGISEQGVHSDLLLEKGIYYKMWNCSCEANDWEILESKKNE